MIKTRYRKGKSLYAALKGDIASGEERGGGTRFRSLQCLHCRAAQHMVPACAGHLFSSKSPRPVLQGPRRPKNGGSAPSCRPSPELLQTDGVPYKPAELIALGICMRGVEKNRCIMG